MYLPMLAEISIEFYFFIVFAAIVLLILLGIMGKFISLWFQALVSGTPIPLLNIIGMSLRKIPPRVIVDARINSFKAGLKQISVADLETHYLAGGHITRVVEAMIAADKANIELDWRRATAIDLAGRDIRDAVQTSVYPKVIDCPSGGEYMKGVAQNGIEILVKARVTVRTNILQLVGGATEETIIARVGEGIVSAIGASETHQNVLAAPDAISRLVLEKGLDSSTAFRILSIDIVEMVLGRNVGAELQTNQAEADKRVAQAFWEQKRAEFVAVEQENKAKIRDKEALLIEAQALIPKAIAYAFEHGKLGVMDYQRYLNIDADTQMRKALGKSESETK